MPFRSHFGRLLTSFSLIYRQVTDSRLVTTQSVSPRDNSRASSSRSLAAEVMAPSFSELSTEQLAQLVAGDDGDDGDGSDEDLSDEAIKATHEVVLQQMKARIQQLKEEFKQEHGSQVGPKSPRPRGRGGGGRGGGRTAARNTSASASSHPGSSTSGTAEERAARVE